MSAFKDRVRVLTCRQAPVSLHQMIEDLNPVLRGWGTYFALGDVVSLFEDLDSWIRMRLRSKARGSKAHPASNAIMPNRVLRAYGLVSLEDIVRSRRRLSPA
ncbi:MAG TPA: group II intron maturase-specific domain-containing protein [Acidimicrobiales bacterium]|nr:group II intron maturase-specific domain-containing protein [Acidimicrobiales bacterium]